MFFSLIDIIFILFLFFMSLIGYKKGFISKAYDIVSMIIVLVVAYLFAKPISSLIQIYPYDQNNLIASLVGKIMNQIIVFIGLLFCLFLIKKALAIFIKPLLKKIVGILKLTDIMNHTLGMIFGFVEGVFISYCALVLIVIPFVPQGKEMIEQSFLSQRILALTPQIEEVVENIDIQPEEISTETLLKSLILAENMNILEQEQFQIIFDEYLKDDIQQQHITLSKNQKDSLQSMLEKYEYDFLTIQKILKKINESE